MSEILENKNKLIILSDVRRGQGGIRDSHNAEPKRVRVLNYPDFGRFWTKQGIINNRFYQSLNLRDGEVIASRR